MIKECRLHVAKDLLLKTKKTIDEIVFEAGFSNKVTFFKVFREKYGCTPKKNSGPNTWKKYNNYWSGMATIRIFSNFHSKKK